MAEGSPILFLVSNGLLEHAGRMGTAVWEYLWLIDKVTRDEDDGQGKFNGLVLGGRPVSAAGIARDLKEHVETAKRNLRKLEKGRYIVRRRLPENQCSFIVTNSKKWLWERERRNKNVSERGNENVSTADTETLRGRSINVSTNKEDTTDTTVDTTKTNPAPHGAPDPDPLPDWIPLESWKGFVDHRLRLRAPLTPRAIKLTIDKLKSFRERGHLPAAVLDQSVINGWKGIFELKGVSPNGSKNRGEIRQADNAAAAQKAAAMLRGRSGVASQSNPRAG
jgi:hypothetical protein